MSAKRRRRNDVEPRRLLTVVCWLYRRLPKKGKPRRGECTTLAAFVATRGEDVVQVLSLATGTKCLPATQSAAGRLADSHAEILAKRAAVDYVLRAADDDATSLFRRDASCGKLHLEENVRFHLVVTSPPCGDASIGATSTTGAKPVRVLNRRDPPKTAESQARTPPEAGDVEGERSCPGVVRRKPGKGEATASMSCSDKILRWTFLGFQGSRVLPLLGRPLYLSSVTVCTPEPEMEDTVRAALLRAVVTRGQELSHRLQPPFQWTPPEVYVVEAPPELPSLPDGLRLPRSNDCINWTLSPGPLENGVCGGQHEVTLGNSGTRLGSPKLPNTLIPAAFQSRLSPEQRALKLKPTLEDLQIREVYKTQWARLTEPPSLFSLWLHKHTTGGSVTAPPRLPLENPPTDPAVHTAVQKPNELTGS